MVEKQLITRTERGWAGHYICSNKCLFRRNTLLEYKDHKIIISTVGLMKNLDKWEMIGHNRYYETMVFHAKPFDTRYYDADVSNGISFSSPWSINIIDADDLANNMHEVVVQEITTGLLAGNSFNPHEDDENNDDNRNIGDT